MSEDDDQDNNAMEYLSIFNAVSEGVVLQRSDGTIYAANPSAERILGRSLEEIRGVSPINLPWRTIHEDGSSFPGDTHPSMLALKTGIRCTNVVMGIFRPDDSLAWVSVNSEPLFHPDAARPYAVVTTFADITDRKQLELRNEHERAQLRALLRTIPDLVWLKDQDGVFLACNAEFEQLFGAREDDIIGKTDFDFVDENLAEFFRQKDREAMRANKPSVNEESLTYAGSGRTVTVETIKTPMRNEKGELIGVVGIARDITARKQMEQNLRTFYTAIEQSPISVIITDKDANIQYINPCFTKVTGYAYDDAIGRNPRILKSGQTEKKTYEYLWRQIKSGHVWHGEFLNKRKDGNLYWEDAHIAPVTDSAGNLANYVCLKIDITRRKHAETLLQESENRFRIMMNSVPVIIWMTEISGAKTLKERRFFNQQWHDFTGCSIEQAQDGQWLNWLHPDDQDRYLEVYTDALLNGKDFKLEYRLLRQDGVYRWVLDSGVVRKTDGGELLGHIGTCLDITDQKFYESIRTNLEHVAQLNVVGEMASNLTHELSQPLSAANNYLVGCLHRMDSEKWDRDDLRAAVHRAHQQTELAGKIINNLRDLVRKKDRERDLIDLNLLIKDAIDLMASDILHRNIMVHTDLSFIPPVMANKVEIEQVLLNLIKNAIESMNSCERREVHISSDINDAGEIQVSVSDCGPGISTVDLNNIFNPFWTTKSDGLGLGLSICRTLLENHGGRIWVDAQYENGARFNFTLPAGAEHG